LPPPTGLGPQILEHSRTAFGKRRSDVEAELLARHQVTTSPQSPIGVSKRKRRGAS
jgi:hypothetical protein